MTDEKRTGTYLAQTGRKSLTPRQRRRVEKKRRHAKVREASRG